MTIDRPLKLGEILAETVRIYGERLGAALGIGALVALAYVAAAVVHAVVGVAIVAVAFTLAYAAAARLVSGDSFGEACAQVGLRLPALAVLAFVVAVPFAVAASYLFLVVLAVGWLALTGFSIPVAMLELGPVGQGSLPRLGYALQRSVTLARTQYLHAAGVAAALVLIYIFVGVLLSAALSGFAGNSRFAALVLVQIVLAPFFFVGLSVLYFEQRARALSSARQH